MTLDKLQGQEALVEIDLLLDDPPPPRLVRGKHRHHALADRGHLRPPVVVDDRGDDVPAEGRPDLQQQLLVKRVRLGLGDVADLQIGAIGRHPGPHRRGHPRGQVPTQRRRPVHHNLRPVLLDQPAQHPSVRSGLVVGQVLVFDEVNVIGTMGNQSLRQPADPKPGQYDPHADPQLISQLAGLPAQLQRDVVQGAVFLLGKDPDLALTIYLDHRSLKRLLTPRFGRRPTREPTAERPLPWAQSRYSPL